MVKFVEIGKEENTDIILWGCKVKKIFYFRIGEIW